MSGHRHNNTNMLPNRAHSPPFPYDTPSDHVHITNLMSHSRPQRASTMPIPEYEPPIASRPPLPEDDPFIDPPVPLPNHKPSTTTRPEGSQHATHQGQFISPPTLVAASLPVQGLPSPANTYTCPSPIPALASRPQTFLAPGPSPLPPGEATPVARVQSPLMSDKQLPLPPRQFESHFKRLPPTPNVQASAVAAEPLTSPPFAQIAPIQIPSPEPGPEIFLAHLPPRPAPIHTSIFTKLRLYTSPRPKLTPPTDRGEDIELGAMPSRQQQQRWSWYGGVAGARLKEGKWWKVCCSVKIGVAVVIVVGFWGLIVMGATGRMRTTGY